MCVIEFKPVLNLKDIYIFKYWFILGSSQASPEDSGDEGNTVERRRSSSRRKNKKGSGESRDGETSKTPNMLQVVDKNSQNAVNSAAKELRRNYSKKVADKLSLLTKNSLKILSKHFASASTDVKVEVCFHSSSYFFKDRNFGK